MGKIQVSINVNVTDMTLNRLMTSLIFKIIRMLTCDGKNPQSNLFPAFSFGNLPQALLLHLDGLNSVLSFLFQHLAEDEIYISIRLQFEIINIILSVSFLSNGICKTMLCVLRDKPFPLLVASHVFEQLQTFKYVLM